MRTPSSADYSTCQLSPLQENTPLKGEEADDLVRCRFWRQIKEGVYEEWSEVSFTVDASKAAEDVEVSGNNGESAYGVRRRLLVGVRLPSRDVSALCVTMTSSPSC